MRRILFILLIVLAVPIPVEAAPILTWDPVTTGMDGQSLGAGLEVTEYRVYQCGPGVGSCNRADATRIATVPAPTTQFDLGGQSVPRAYVVTAVNKAGESADSLPYKVTPPDVPKNVRLQ